MVFISSFSLLFFLLILLVFYKDKPIADSSHRNPNFSAGRGQECYGLKSALANTLQDSVSKILNTKQVWCNS
jgi:hypothetical protein